jgi:hypothetical protein
MKKMYIRPMAEKLTFDYMENVVASGAEHGHRYRLYTDGYYACHETATDIWVDELPTP